MSKEKKETGYSYTSNTVKLLKHMDKLQELQKGRSSPIMVHMAVTNKCNLNCIHCCFKNRDKGLDDLPLDTLKKGMRAFKGVGVNAVEITGGGEPTMYKYLDEALEFLHSEGFHIGLITNGIKTDHIKNWEYLDWVRVSLNGFDYGKIPDISNIVGPDISGCYIWNNNSSKVIGDVVSFAESNGIPTRIAPDCIKPLLEINKEMGIIKRALIKYNVNNVFVSDFNTKTSRRNSNCYIHNIKPYFYVDGNVYVCPSSELAIENGANINEAFKICDVDGIIRTYLNSSGRIKREHNCSFCKYAATNEFLEDVLTETHHNDFV